MKRNEIKTKAGRVTAYGFACGYIEKFSVEKTLTDKSVELYYESGTLHVRAHDFKKCERISWDCFDSIPEARKAFDAIVHEWKKELTHRILELGRYPGGFAATEFQHKKEADSRVGIYRGDLGVRSRAFWRSYARTNGFTLRIEP